MSEKVTQVPFLNLYECNAGCLNEIEEAALRVIRSGRYIGGEECAQFESRLISLSGAPHAVGVSNGLDALRLIIRGYIELGRLAPGDEVLVPANTYIASVLALTEFNLTPVLIDIDKETLLIDSSSARESLTEKTRAILLVHLYGRVAWNEELKRIASENQLIVIEDNAQAIGGISTTPGMHSSMATMTGAIGDAAAFSFYPTKNVGAIGDAGAVTTWDAELAKAIRALANYGSDVRYHNIYQGYNCRLDPIQAAILNVKLQYINEWNNRRREISNFYIENIKNRNIILPSVPKSDSEHVWHQFPIRVLSGRRDLFQKLLSINGVGTDIHYPLPLHLQDCYKGKLPYYFLPRTERVATELLSLPINQGMTQDEVQRVVCVINEIDI